MESVYLLQRKIINLSQRLTQPSMKRLAYMQFLPFLPYLGIFFHGQNSTGFYVTLYQSSSCGIVFTAEYIVKQSSVLSFVGK